MIRILVTTTVVSRQDMRKLVQFPLEVEFESLDAAYDHLVDKGAIKGMRVTMNFLADGRRMVRERFPQIVGLGGVATISVCHYDLVEQAEVGTDE